MTEPLTEAEWTDLLHIIARYSVHDRDANDIVAGLRSDRDFAILLAAERERIAPLVEAERECSGGPRLLGICGCLCHQVVAATETREDHDDQ